MKCFKSTLCAASLAASVLLPTFRACAQDGAQPAPSASAAAPAGPAAPGGGGGMEQFRQRMNERLKTALKATDDEWSVIQPLLEKVQDKQRDVLMNRFGGMMRGGGGPGGEGRRRRAGEEANNGGTAAAPAPQAGGENRGQRRDPRPTSAQAQALEASLQDDNANVNDIKTKLAALRDERKKANADLESAREDLRKVLNMRQEAVLVLSGMLD